MITTPKKWRIIFKFINKEDIIIFIYDNHLFNVIQKMGPIHFDVDPDEVIINLVKQL